MQKGITSRDFTERTTAMKPAGLDAPSNLGPRPSLPNHPDDRMEAIEAPEKGAKCPREVSRGKPKYRECRDCRARGKSTVATWVCVECSQNEGQEVDLCENCLSERHEEHYAEEIVY